MWAPLRPTVERKTQTPAILSEGLSIPLWCSLHKKLLPCFLKCNHHKLDISGHIKKCTSQKKMAKNTTQLPQTGLTNLLFSEFNSIKPPHLVLMSGNWLQITFNLLKSTNPKNLQSTYQFCWLNIKMPINTELQEANTTKIIDKKKYVPLFHSFKCFTVKWKPL